MRINNYDISTDKYNWTISEVTIVKEGKTAGKEVLSLIGHYGSIEALISSFKDYLFRKVWNESDNMLEASELMLLALEDIAEIKNMEV